MQCNAMQLVHAMMSYNAMQCNATGACNDAMQCNAMQLVHAMMQCSTTCANTIGIQVVYSM